MITEILPTFAAETFKTSGKMRRQVLFLLVSVLLLTSCGTYTGEGAATGGYFGSIIGSVIGGISDGRRGSDIGSLIGMAGGAVVGAVIGNAADEAAAREREEYMRDREQRHARRYGNVSPDDQDYFDPNNGGNDIISLDGVTPPSSTTPPPSYTPPVTPPASPAAADRQGVIIRNAKFEDSDGNGVLIAGEDCKVSFEIVNRTGQVVYDVQPLVYDLSNNKHIHISQNLHVESILPGKGIRYTATIKGDRRLRDGVARIRLGVAIGNEEIEGQTREFVVQTRKK